MVYCTACGKQNDEGARFCSNCGSPLGGAPGPAPGTPPTPGVATPPVMPRRPYRRQNDECQDECQKSGRGTSIFWGIIVILFGVWLLFEFGLKNATGLPQWVYDFNLWWLFPVIVGLAIIVWGIRILAKRG